MFTSLISLSSIDTKELCLPIYAGVQEHSRRTLSVNDRHMSIISTETKYAVETSCQ